MLTGIDALSAQRRDLEDRLGLQDRLVRIVSAGPAAFGDLVTATPLSAVARARAAPALAPAPGDRPIVSGRRRVAGVAGWEKG